MGGDKGVDMTCCWKRLGKSAMYCYMQSISKINEEVGGVVRGDSTHAWMEVSHSREGLTDNCLLEVIAGSLAKNCGSRYSSIVYVCM